jgi:hypothetical protein
MVAAFRLSHRRSVRRGSKVRSSLARCATGRTAAKPWAVPTGASPSTACSKAPIIRGSPRVASVASNDASTIRGAAATARWIGARLRQSFPGAPPPVRPPGGAGREWLLRRNGHTGITGPRTDAG